MEHDLWTFWPQELELPWKQGIFDGVIGIATLDCGRRSGDGPPGVPPPATARGNGGDHKLMAWSRQSGGPLCPVS